jgi:hypothetical protein
MSRRPKLSYQGAGVANGNQDSGGTGNQLMRSSDFGSRFVVASY